MYGDATWLHFVISPALTDKAIAGLDSLGFTGGRILTEQKVDIRAGSDSGFSQVTHIEKKRTPQRPCSFFAHGTDKQFWPAPDAASLGESILIHEKCSVRVHVGEVLGGRSDKAAAETLLHGLTWAACVYTAPLRRVPQYSPKS
jgi:hypothetical protein